MQRLILVALWAALLACAGDDGPTAPSAPNVVGTYSGASPWIFGVSFPDLGLGHGFLHGCAGSLSITNQTGSIFSFSGSFVMGPGGDCVAGLSGTVSGTISPDQYGFYSLNFDATVPDRGDLLEDFLLVSFSCVYVSGDRRFNGALSADGLRLQASVRAFYSCGSRGRGSVYLAFSGTRQ